MNNMPNGSNLNQRNGNLDLSENLSNNLGPTPDSSAEQIQPKSVDELVSSFIDLNIEKNLKPSIIRESLNGVSDEHIAQAVRKYIDICISVVCDDYDIDMDGKDPESGSYKKLAEKKAKEILRLNDSIEGLGNKLILLKNSTVETPEKSEKEQNAILNGVKNVISVFSSFPNKMKGLFQKKAVAEQETEEEPVAVPAQIESDPDTHLQVDSSEVSSDISNVGLGTVSNEVISMLVDNEANLISSQLPEDSFLRYIEDPTFLDETIASRDEGLVSLEAQTPEQRRGIFAGIQKSLAKMDLRKVDWKAVGEAAKENKGLVVATVAAGGATMYISAPLILSIMGVQGVVGGTTLVGTKLAAGYLGAQGLGTFGSLGIGALSNAGTLAGIGAAVSAGITGTLGKITHSKLFKKPSEYEAEEKALGKSMEKTKKGFLDHAITTLVANHNVHRSDRQSLEKLVSNETNALYAFLLTGNDRISAQINVGDPIPELFTRPDGSKIHIDNYGEYIITKNIANIKDGIYTDPKAPKTIENVVEIDPALSGELKAFLDEPTTPQSPVAPTPDVSEILKSPEVLRLEENKSQAVGCFNLIKTRDLNLYPNLNLDIFDLMGHNMSRIKQSFVDLSLEGDDLFEEIQSELGDFDFSRIGDPSVRYNWGETGINIFAEGARKVLEKYAGESFENTISDPTSIVSEELDSYNLDSQDTNTSQTALDSNFNPDLTTSEVNRVLYLANKSKKMLIIFNHKDSKSEIVNYLKTNKIGIIDNFQYEGLEGDNLYEEIARELPAGTILADLDDDNLSEEKVSIFFDAALKVLDRFSGQAETINIQASIENKLKQNELDRQSYLAETSKHLLDGINAEYKDSGISLNEYSFRLLGMNMEEINSHGVSNLHGGKGIFDLIQDKLGSKFDFHDIGDKDIREDKGKYTTYEINLFGTAALEVLSELSGQPVSAVNITPISEVQSTLDVSSGELGPISVDTSLPAAEIKPTNFLSAELISSRLGEFARESLDQIGKIMKRPSTGKSPIFIQTAGFVKLFNDNPKNEIIKKLITLINDELDSNVDFTQRAFTQKSDIVKTLGGLGMFSGDLGPIEKTKIETATLAVLMKLSKNNTTQPDLNSGSVENQGENSIPDPSIYDEVDTNESMVSEFERINIGDYQELKSTNADISTELADSLDKLLNPPIISQETHIQDDISASVDKIGTTNSNTISSDLEFEDSGSVFPEQSGDTLQGELIPDNAIEKSDSITLTQAKAAEILDRVKVMSPKQNLKFINDNFNELDSLGVIAEITATLSRASIFRNTKHLKDFSGKISTPQGLQELAIVTNSVLANHTNDITFIEKIDEIPSEEIDVEIIDDNENVVDLGTDQAVDTAAVEAVTLPQAIVDNSDVTSLEQYPPLKMSEFLAKIDETNLKDSRGSETNILNYLTDYFDSQHDPKIKVGIKFAGILNSIGFIYGTKTIANIVNQNNDTDFFALIRDPQKFDDLVGQLEKEWGNDRKSSLLREFLDLNSDTDQSKASKQYLDALEKYMKTGELPLPASPTSLAPENLGTDQVMDVTAVEPIVAPQAIVDNASPLDEMSNDGPDVAPTLNLNEQIDQARQILSSIQTMGANDFLKYFTGKITNIVNFKLGGSQSEASLLDEIQDNLSTDNRFTDTKNIKKFNNARKLSVPEIDELKNKAIEALGKFVEEGEKGKTQNDKPSAITNNAEVISDDLNFEPTSQSQDINTDQKVSAAQLEMNENSQETTSNTSSLEQYTPITLSEFLAKLDETKLKDKYRRDMGILDYLLDYFEGHLKTKDKNSPNFSNIVNSLEYIRGSKTFEKIVSQNNKTDFFALLKDPEQFDDLVTQLEKEWGDNRKSNLIRKILYTNSDTVQSKATLQYLNALERYMKTGEVPLFDPKA
jgi:hypothetical protein